MRPSFEPRLVNDGFGDPGLYVDLRDEKRALLFDLGDLSALPPRKLLRLAQVFVTHRHVDHFAGFDHLLRVLLGRKERLALVGGPGLIDGVAHKLQAYAWNVVHRYEVPLAFDVREVDADGMVHRMVFSSRSRFAGLPAEAEPLAGDVVHEEETFRVRARASSTTASPASPSRSRKRRTSTSGRTGSRRSACRPGRGCRS